jgi:hypothetical protein
MFHIFIDFGKAPKGMEKRRVYIKLKLNSRDFESVIKNPFIYLDLFSYQKN